MIDIDRACSVVFADEARLNRTIQKCHCDSIDAVHDAVIDTMQSCKEPIADDEIFRTFIAKLRCAMRAIKWQERRHGMVTGRGRLPQGGLVGFEYIDRDDCLVEPSTHDIYFNNCGDRHHAETVVISAMDHIRPGAAEASIRTVREDDKFSTRGMAHRLNVGQTTAWRIVKEYKEHVIGDTELRKLLKLAMEG